MLDSGAYCLVIRLEVDSVVEVGRLGRFRFAKGYYVYCGSAMNGLATRIARHQRRAKKLHWHIDHLLALPAARLLASVPYPSTRRQECVLNQALQRRRGAMVPVAGFGSSDCANGCPAHLTHFAARPALRAPQSGIRNLESGIPSPALPEGMSHEPAD
ncbi:MAG: GIY-YIG nuclease family protein [Planctomycetes bacterium]|nr:GIY-YIG nuclease family protein [Planctomycetota bacterium]